MDNFFLELKSISKSFQGVQALKNVNFQIRPGEATCLVGENGCGKSTLIKIISGVYTPDSGEILIGGTSYHSITPQQSIAAGIQVIYQDLSVFPNLTVAENITLGYNVATHNRWVSRRHNRDMAAKILDEIGVELDLDAEVRSLSIGQRQVVAICRALLLEAKLVIMDEPTTALTSKEIEALYGIIHGLKQRGIALVFVSHKLDEVFEVAEQVVILRNGENVISGPREQFDKSKVSYYMTGREVRFDPFVPQELSEKPLFEVHGLSHPLYFHDISFKLYQGEILGITGLLGSGRTELAETIFGLRRPSGGEMVLGGETLKIKESADAVRAGIGYVPEDRLSQGLFLDIEIDRNIGASILRKFSQHFNIMDKPGIKRTVERSVQDLDIRLGKLSDPVKSLSGGNQQRVVLAKWLATDPRLLILNCPTVGVDVGSKSSIHQTIKELASKGMGIVVISDDLPEILSVCSRIMVMNRGHITGEYRATEANEAMLQAQLSKV